jgi:hypothetical protein
MKSQVEKLIKKNPQLIHSDMMKVTSHVQRQSGEWFINTIMIENCEVPFKYKRKKRYKDLTGATVNLTYYPQAELVAGIEFETMKVVRIRVS